jgi:hypothetical protein
MSALQVVGERGSTAEQTATYMAAVSRLLTSKVALKHQQHKATCYSDFMAKLTFRSMSKHISIHTEEFLSIKIL